MAALTTQSQSSPFTQVVEYLKRVGPNENAYIYKLITAFKNSKEFKDEENAYIHQLITAFKNSEEYKDDEATQKFIYTDPNYDTHSLFPMKCADSKKDKTPIHLANESFIPPELMGNVDVVFSPGSMKEMAYRTFDNLVDKDIMKLIEITRIKGAGDQYLSIYTDKVIHDCGPLFDGNGKAPKLATKLRADPKRIVTWGAKIDTSSTSGGEPINSEFNKVNSLVFDDGLMHILGYGQPEDGKPCSLIVPTAKSYNDNRTLPKWKDLVDPQIDFKVNDQPVPNMLRRAVGIKSKANDIESTYIKSLGDGIVATEIVSEGFQMPGAGTFQILTGLTCDSIVAWQWNFFIEVFNLMHAQFVHTHNEKGGKKISKLYFRPSKAGVNYFEDVKIEYKNLRSQYRNVVSLLNKLKTNPLFMDDESYDKKSVGNYDDLINLALGELRGLLNIVDNINSYAIGVNTSNKEDKQDELKNYLISLKQFSLYPVLFERRRDMQIKTTRSQWRWCEAQEKSHAAKDITFFGQALNKKTNNMGTILKNKFSGGARNKVTQPKQERPVKIKSVNKGRRLSNKIKRIEKHSESCYMELEVLENIYNSLLRSISSKEEWKIILDYIHNKRVKKLNEVLKKEYIDKIPADHWHWKRKPIHNQTLSKWFKSIHVQDTAIKTKLTSYTETPGLGAPPDHDRMAEDTNHDYGLGAPDPYRIDEDEEDEDESGDLDDSIICLKIEIYSIFISLLKYIFHPDDTGLFMRSLEFFRKNEIIDTIIKRESRQALPPSRPDYITLRLNCLYDEGPSLVNLLYYKYHTNPDYSFNNNGYLIFELLADMFIEDPVQANQAKLDYNSVNSVNFDRACNMLRSHMINEITSITKGGGLKNKHTKKRKKNDTKKRKNKPKGKTFKKIIITKSQKKR